MKTIGTEVRKIKKWLGLSCCCLFFRLFTIFLTKFLNPSGGIDDFLLAGIEWMADRANLDMQGLAHGGTRLEYIAATAGNGNFLIIRVNICFHDM